MSEKKPTMRAPYDGPERRRMPLSEEQIEAIAEKAADRAVKKLTDQVYREVGRGVISKFVWLVGAASIGVALWLNAKGIITFK